MRRRALWIAIPVWLAASVAGLAVMAAYSNRPGERAAAPERWPHPEGLALDADRPTLVMLAHPKCDCTRASLNELAELSARAPRAARTYVVFMRPETMGTLWDDTDLWRKARAIPAVHVLADRDGRIAEMFGAATSGQILVYDATGRLQFNGGATIARGHEGDNPGFQSLLALLNGGQAPTPGSPVFGCPLFGPERKEPGAL